jgi:peroxiredoxin
MVKNKVVIGDKAPNFKIESYNAGTINLESLIGKQKIVLIFSRYFGCPICQLDLSEVLQNVSKIAEKAKLLYITQSGKDIALKVIQDKNIKFPVIPSTKDELYATYGLGKFTLSAIAALPGKASAAKKAGFIHGESEGTETQCPGQFVIDEKGIIIHAEKGWLNIDSLLQSL